MPDNSKLTNILITAFPAFKSRNYKLYFSGQLISLIGTWLQIVALGWLVLKMTNSAFLIGLITALGSLPSLFFTLFGGVIVDRFPKKKILFITQGSAMILAITLGILTVFNVINIWEIAIIAFLMGTVAAIDIPARQAFVAELVFKDQIPSAIALNSATFNAARVIGPGIAGLLIAWIGTGGAFLINGLSYIAVIAALWSMNIESIIAEKKTGTLTAIKEGLVYSFSHPIIRMLIIFTAVSSVFGWSYSTVMPLIAANEFYLDAAGLGYMYAAGGLGALSATLLIGLFSKKVSSVYFILGGNTLFSVCIILFSFTTNLTLALVLLFFAGFGLLSQFAMINTTIQRLVKSEFRGRVLSIYIFMFMGLTPLGNFEVGLLSENMGTGFAIRTGAFIVFLFGVLVYFYRDRIKKDFTEYKKVI
ncbi:MAG: MFS transporter [Ignavibacteria bacterium]|nr:MFS transporter [Ignavibacteria bacterium]MBK9404054.1 MFS transporter [Ignavibacteria bacterium]